MNGLQKAGRRALYFMSRGSFLLVLPPSNFFDLESALCLELKAVLE